MSNQDQGREYARPERTGKEGRSARRPGTAKGAGRSADARRDETATRLARRAVVATRSRGESPPARAGARAESGTYAPAPGPHAGKGPKGYRRSDGRILADICDRLLADCDVDASEVVVTVADGAVTFEGTVLDHGTRHLVECIGTECLGVRNVHSNLRVVHAGGAGGSARRPGARRADRGPSIEFE